MEEKKRAFSVGFVSEEVLDGFQRVKSCLMTVKGKPVTNEETLLELIKSGGPLIQEQMLETIRKRSEDAQSNPLF